MRVISWRWRGTLAVVTLGLSMLSVPASIYADTVSDCPCKPTEGNFEARSEPARPTDVCAASRYQTFCRIDWSVRTNGSTTAPQSRRLKHRSEQTLEAVTHGKAAEEAAFGKNLDTKNPAPQIMTVIGRGGLPKPTAKFNYANNPLTTISGFLAIAGAALDLTEEGKSFDQFIERLRAVHPTELRGAFQPLFSRESKVSNFTLGNMEMTIAPGCLRMTPNEARTLKSVAVSSLIGRTQPPCREK